MYIIDTGARNVWVGMTKYYACGGTDLVATKKGAKGVDGKALDVVGRGKL